MEDLAERGPNYPSRSYSLSSYVPIDPFKPSVAYGRKNLMTPATPRRATTMDDNPKVANRHQVAFSSSEPSHAQLPLDHKDHTGLPPGFAPVDSYIPPLDNDHIIRLPPPFEIASRVNSIPSSEPLPQIMVHPLPQRTSIPWGITDQRTSSPTPIVENASDGPLPVIRRDSVDVDIWEEYRGSGGFYQ